MYVCVSLFMYVCMYVCELGIVGIRLLALYEQGYGEAQGVYVCVCECVSV